MKPDSLRRLGSDCRTDSALLRFLYPFVCLGSLARRIRRLMPPVPWALFLSVHGQMNRRRCRAADLKVGNRPWRADLLMIRDRRGQLKHQHLLADHPEQQVIVDGDPAKVHRNVDAAEEEEEEEEERPTEEEEEGPTLPKKWAGS